MIQTVDIAVLGAGMSGLSQAYYLTKKHPEATLLVVEATNRVGGWVQTEHRDGFILEQGPRGIRPKGKGQAVLQLVEDLGLWDQLEFADDSAKIRYIFQDGKLEKVPAGFLSALSSPITKGMFSALFRDLFQKPIDRPDESFEDFMVRHFGQSFADRIFDPMVSGIWGAQISKLSIDAAMPILKQFEKEKGSVIRGFMKYKSPDFGVSYDKDVVSKALFSFKNGMETMVKRLGETLGDKIQFNTTVASIKRVDGMYHIQLSTGDEIHCTKVVSTIPSYQLASVMKAAFPKLSTLLSEVPYAPMAVVSILYDRELPFDGFGFLIPSKEGQKMLGATANHKVFPAFAPKGKSCFSVMIGGASDTSFHEKDEAYFLKVAQEDLAAYLKVTDKPSEIFVKRLPKAIPQYNVGHLERVASIQSLQPENFVISGNFIGGVSLIDIVLNAKKIAETL